MWPERQVNNQPLYFLYVDIHNFVSCDPTVRMAQEMSTSGCTAPKARATGSDDIKCYACVLNEGFCLRANTVSAYDEVNRQVCLLRVCTLGPGMCGASV